MKYREFHKLIKRAGWVEIRQSGSHKIYAKPGFKNTAVPDHGSKEFPEPLRLKLTKDMGL